LSISVKKKLNQLQKLAKTMRVDLSILKLEKLETKFKSIIKVLINYDIGNVEIALSIAKIQKDLGLLFKYKSYGVKACTPLGYSIFLLNRGEGFSFQNHLSFKTELFNVLSVLPGGYLFVASQKDWEKCFEEKKFKDWFNKKPGGQYDKFKSVPTAGDIIKIHKTGIVHTAIGCVLEEYANTSSDMVQRLYDQNFGKKIPSSFSRKFVQKSLDKIKFPEENNLVSVNHKKKRIKSKKMKFGKVVILNNSVKFVAARYSISASKTQKIFTKNNYISIYVTNGEGKVSIFSDKKTRDMSLTFKIKKGETTMFIPKTVWTLENTSRKPLCYSFLSVNKLNALR